MVEQGRSISPKSFTLVQPLKGIAKACVNLVLDEQAEENPSLICLPVSYAYGGTTRQ